MTSNDEMERQRFEGWWQDEFHNGNPPRGGWEFYRANPDEELDGLWKCWHAALKSKQGEV